MWISKSASEIEAAAERGDLEETHTLDAKVALPGSKKNKDLAVDVCAMTVDGGSLVYGLGEDDNDQLTVLSPIELDGLAERVAQVAETSITEPPFIRVQPLPLESDPSRGYLLVVVPQSARAPHQVISGKDGRYYGRGAKGNRILSESEVATLYARRERWEVDRERLIREELARSPEADPKLGYIVAFARPVAPDDSMVERVSSGSQEILRVLVEGSRTWGDIRPDRYSGPGYDPDLRRAVRVWRRGSAGWTISTSFEQDNEPRSAAQIDLDFDGTGHFFCGRIADTMEPQGTKVLFETILAGNLASFFAAMGAFYEAAGYVGQVDVGVAVTGIEGALPWGLHMWGDGGFSGPTPHRTARVSAAQLRDAPRSVTLSLIQRLLDVTRETGWSPFADPPPAEADPA
jgi:Schlafen, AlbA_2